MALPFLGLFIFIVAMVSLFRKRNDKLQKEIEENFWAREQEANFVRRQDISGLSYITIPIELFSIGAIEDEKLSEYEQALTAFCDKKILNLAGLTNTDLKMTYGPANLPALTEYDQNYADLLCLLTDYANRFIEIDAQDFAIPILEFCVETGSDVSAHYTILANYYKENKHLEKLEALQAQAANLNSIMKTSIQQKLTAIITP